MLTIDFSLSAIAARKDDSDKEESEDEDAEGEPEEKEIPLKKVDQPRKENDECDNTVVRKLLSEKLSEAPEKVDIVEKPDEPATKKTFIKLNCPHCGIKAVTFRKYDIHLQGRMHMGAMRKVSIKQKSILAQMRLAQRNAQNELEKNNVDLTPRTNFCPLCKLNYKQRKAVHQSSEAHKNMKKFLMPYCKVCSITFKSPMMYENHCCSIEHLKVFIMNYAYIIRL